MEALRSELSGSQGALQQSRLDVDGLTHQVGAQRRTTLHPVDTSMYARCRTVARMAATCHGSQQGGLLPLGLHGFLLPVLPSWHSGVSGADTALRPHVLPFCTSSLRPALIAYVRGAAWQVGMRDRILGMAWSELHAMRGVSGGASPSASATPPGVGR